MVELAEQLPSTSSSNGKLSISCQELELHSIRLFVQQLLYVEHLTCNTRVNINKKVSVSVDLYA